MDNIQYTKKDGSSLLVPVFNGKTIHTMPELVAQGYTPISVAGIMEQRIKAWESGDPELAQSWGRNYFDSGDGIMYHPDGRIKVVPDSENLRSVNPNTTIEWYGGQILTEGTFDRTQGHEFSREDVEKYANQPLSQKDVLNNPIWLALAGEDEELLRAYVGQVFSKIDRTKPMGVWVRNIISNYEAEDIWCFCRNSDIISSDFVGSGDRLSMGDDGRLVGFPSCLEKRLIRN